MIGLARFVFCTFSLVFVAGCASIQARSAFGRGEKARAAGDYAEAIGHYEKAAAQDPRPQYQEALSKARGEALAQKVELAQRAEAQGNFQEATARWTEALAFAPDNAEVSARRDLASLRTRNADPVEFYAAAKKLVAALPSDPGAQAALTEARKTAVAYHVRLAGVYADTGALAQAFKEYEAARKLDPQHPAFASERFKNVAAKHFEAKGDELLAAGDALGAFTAFEQAAAIKKTPNLERKMAQAKRGAGNLLELLGQAEAFAKIGKWEDAADLYSGLVGRKGAPADVAEKAQQARAESAKVRAGRTQAYLERQLVDKAVIELRATLEHTDGPLDPLRLLLQAVDDLNSNKVGDAWEKWTSAQAAVANLAVAAVMPRVIEAMALRSFPEVEAKAATDSAAAMVLLRQLEPFSAKIPRYAETKKKLVRSAFGQLIERAKAAGFEARWNDAAELLATALEISQPPAALGAKLADATRAMEAANYEQALSGYEAAVALEQRSQLAAAGREVAKKARIAELERQVADAKAGEDMVRTTSAYRAILQIDPTHAEAQTGLEALKSVLVEAAREQARSHRAEGRGGAAFVYYRRILEADPSDAEAQSGVEGLRAELALSPHAPLWVAPVLRGVHLGEACPATESALRERTVLYLEKTPDLGISPLTGEALKEADRDESKRPQALLRSALERCEVSKKGGSLTWSVQLAVGAEVLHQSQITATFDPSGVPKDELEDGLPAQRILTEVVGSAAKSVAPKLKAERAKLSDWRLAEARRRLLAGEPEQVARFWAGLALQPNLSPGEKEVYRELERFLVTRYR